MRPSLLTRVPVPRRSVPSPIAAETCVSGTCECTPTVACATFSNNRGLAFTVPSLKQLTGGFKPRRPCRLRLDRRWEVVAQKKGGLAMRPPQPKIYFLLGGSVVGSVSLRMEREQLQSGAEVELAIFL